MAEIWDLYVRDEHGNFHVTDRKGVRGQRLPDGTYHMVVMVWIRNSLGEYLLSRRAPNKTFPLCWEPTGGSALAGETSVQAACREAQEELGVRLDPDEGRHIARALRDYEGCADFVDVWLFEGVDIPIEAVTIQREEVCEAMWASPERIKELVADGTWIPWEKYDPLEMMLNRPMG